MDIGVRECFDRICTAPTHLEAIGWSFAHALIPNASVSTSASFESQSLATLGVFPETAAGRKDSIGGLLPLFNAMA